MASTSPSGGVESVGFLNDMIAQLWDYINVAGAQLVKEMVEPMFKDLLPGTLKALHFKKIDFGKVPIKFDNIDVHTRSEDVIKLDVDMNWQGECDIELKATLIQLGVEKLKLKGRMSVLLCPLVPRLPLFTAAQVAFINPPDLELDFTGAADIADLSIIDDSIRQVIDDVLASMLVLPNRLLVKLDPANDYFKTYQPPRGILRLTVVSGRGFVTPKGFFKDVPDTYCKVRVGAFKPWNTETKNNDTTPGWNEVKDFVLSDLEQLITVNVLDEDLGYDDEIGGGSISIGELIAKGEMADVKLLTKDTKSGSKVDTGAAITLKGEVFELVPDIASFGRPEHKKKDLLVGLATIVVAGACDVPGDRMSIGPNVKVNFAECEFVTPTVLDMPGIDPNQPAFDMAFRIPLTAEMSASPSDFTLTLLDKNSKLATLVIPFEKVTKAPGFCLSSVDSPEIFKLDNGVALKASIRISGIKLSAK